MLATEVLIGAGNRRAAVVTALPVVGEIRRIAEEELATRVRIVEEVTVSVTAAFPVGVALEAPAHWVAVPVGTAAAVHEPAVRAAHPAWEDPAAAAVVAGVVVAGGDE